MSFPTLRDVRTRSGLYDIDPVNALCPLSPWCRPNPRTSSPGEEGIWSESEAVVSTTKPFLRLRRSVVPRLRTGSALGESSGCGPSLHRDRCRCKRRPSGKTAGGVTLVGACPGRVPSLRPRF